MSYKIVRNTDGEVVCFGPNDNNYEPVVKEGEVLTIEDTIPSPSQEDAVVAAQASRDVAEAGCVEKLLGLGLTVDEVGIIVPRGSLNLMEL